jgi:hypothetical protein
MSAETNFLEDFHSILDFHLRQLQVSTLTRKPAKTEDVLRFKSTFSEVFGVLWVVINGQLPSRIQLRHLNDQESSEEDLCAEELCAEDLYIDYPEEVRVVLEGVVLDGFFRNRSTEEIGQMVKVATSTLDRVLERFSLKVVR